jgi:hypothetical protein
MMQQDSLLALLLYDDKHGKLVANLDPGLFEGDYREMAIRAIGYWKQYGKPPAMHSSDLFADILEDGANPGKAKTYWNVLLACAQREHHGQNIAFVLNGLEQFQRRQQCKGAVYQAADQLQRPNPDLGLVQETLRKATQSRDLRFDPGLRLDDINGVLDHIAAHESNEFSTGIKELDERHVVPAREKIMVFLAATSAGKSWWLIHLGKRALWKGKKVCHVTLELSDKDVRGRYLQGFLAVPRWERQRLTMRTKFIRDDHGRLIGFAKEPLEARCSMQGDGFGKQLKKLYGYLPPRWGNIRIVQFPTGALTVGQLKGYLDSLEATEEGFVPDLLLVDYAGIMATESDNYRLSLKRVLEDLRALAVERRIAVATAQQVSKEGAKAKQVNMGHVAEDFSIAMTSDFVVTMTRNEREQEHKLARLFVDKDRNGEQNFGAVISQNYDHGIFAIDSAKLERERYEAMLEKLDGGAARGGAPHLRRVAG